MSNPVITSVINDTLFKDKMVFVDRDVEVPASATLKVGTVLGVITADGQDNQGAFGGFNSTLNTGLQTPVAILAQTLVNEDTSAVKKTSVRVAVKGNIDGANLVFARTGDTLNTLVGGKKVKDVLVANGLVAEDYLENSFLDNGAE